MTNHAKLNVQIIILAAGRGSRMHSDKPKVLHKIAGKTLIQHVISTAKQITDDITIVCGYGADKLTKTINDDSIKFIYQKQQLGTAHAVKLAMHNIHNNKKVLILYGDVPLISVNTLYQLINDNDFKLLTAQVDNPYGYGRIIRQNDLISCIIEEQDANNKIKQITEINSGIIAISGDILIKYLPKITNNNVKKEYYLTDLVKLATLDNVVVESVLVDNNIEILGVNTKNQLAELERQYQYQATSKLCEQGLQILDKHRFDNRGELKFGTDCVIDINVIFNGTNVLGNNVKIGSSTIITNSAIGDDVEILPNCIIEHAIIKKAATIGPFARIRPATTIEEEAKIGNFVETKKSIIGRKSKINHLSYIGDANIAKEVNIGAGTVTCNYDGVNKQQTIIKDKAFIGSNSALIAPLTINEKATIGAGSVITKNVAKNSIALTRDKQRVFTKKSKK